MTYVDGFLAAVPTEGREAYLAYSRKTDAIFKEHGALRVLECWGDDVPEGKLTSMPMAVKCNADETVVFSWVEWPSREARDAGWAMVMADPRMADESNVMPFDAMRLIYGGFKVLLET